MAAAARLIRHNQSKSSSLDTLFRLDNHVLETELGRSHGP
jgi:hypothetical protein